MRNSSVVTVGGLFCGVLLSVSVQAQTSAAPAGNIEHVLVTVPMHRSEAETALPVTVMSDESLRDNVASSLGETLSLSPGLATAGFGPGVGQPVIRGQQGARVSVLQNSTGSADVSNSSADHAVSVEPILAQSIEVLRGPATLLYGGGAIGGVINVIDRRVPVAVPEKPTGAIELRHASVNDENTAVFTLDGGSEPWAFHIDGVSRDSNNTRIPGLAAEHHDDDTTDGYIANSDGDMEAFTLGGSRLFERGFIGVAVNRLDNQYGIPPGAHDHELQPEEHETVRLDVKQTRYDLRADYHFSDSAFDSVRTFLTYSDYRHRELEGEAVGTVWSNDSWEGRLELLHRALSGWHGVFGLQVNQFELVASGEESFIPRTEVSRYGLFAVEDFHRGDWLFELGLRWDREELKPETDTASQSFDSFSVSSSALWQMDANWRLGLALSQSERAPVIEELFSNVGNSAGSYVEHVASAAIEVGDAGLDTEQSNNLDVTLSYANGSVDGFVTVFYNDFRDFIYLATTGAVQDETDILAYRQRDAEFYGTEFELALDLAQLQGGTLSLKVFGDWIYGELETGAYIPRLPPRRLGSRIDYRLQPLRLYLSVLEAWEQDKPGPNEEQTEGYTRWDAGVETAFELGESEELLLFLRLKNLTDEEIRHATSLLREVAPEAGRSVEAGVRWTF